jgi:putative transposase
LAPRRRSYNYTQPGAYFVTIVTHLRTPVLGAVVADGVSLTWAGLAVQQCWVNVQERFCDVTVDTFVVMPDHVHAIVVLSLSDNRTVGLSQVVGWVKQRASRQINAPMRALPPSPLWQRGFHDRIISDADAFTRARRYIIANPARAWVAQGSQTNGRRW